MLGIFKINNKKQEDKLMEVMNTWGKAVYDARKQEVLNGLENDLQKVIFLDWWNGGSLYDGCDENGNWQRAKRYRGVNDHDWEMARGWIMETISLGMG